MSKPSPVSRPIKARDDECAISQLLDQVGLVRDASLLKLAELVADYAFEAELLAAVVLAKVIAEAGVAGGAIEWTSDSRPDERHTVVSLGPDRAGCRTYLGRVEGRHLVLRLSDAPRLREPRGYDLGSIFGFMLFARSEA